MHLMLIGLRGSGKSVMARKLANLLWRTAVDMDKLTLARFPDCGSITEVWKAHGEPAWRQAESDLCSLLISQDGVPGGEWPRKPDLIVAMGGGAPTVPDVADSLGQLQQTGQARVLYLVCHPEILCRRLQSQHTGTFDPTRPALTDADSLLDEIKEVAAQRDPVYRALADHVFDVSDLNIDQACRYVIKQFL